MIFKCNCECQIERLEANEVKLVYYVLYIIVFKIHVSCILRTIDMKNSPPLMSIVIPFNNSLKL